MTNSTIHYMNYLVLYICKCSPHKSFFSQMLFHSSLHHHSWNLYCCLRHHKSHRLSKKVSHHCLSIKEFNCVFKDIFAETYFWIHCHHLCYSPWPHHSLKIGDNTSLFKWNYSRTNKEKLTWTRFCHWRIVNVC